MNILVCPLQHIADTAPVYCPGCHSHDHCKHGIYTRKGFHIPYGIVSMPVAVQRYRCRNKECPRCTFSVLPPMMLRYCRFFWPCLLLFGKTHGKGLPVSRGVARRTAVMLAGIASWVKGLYREVTDGKAGSDMVRMVKIIVGKIGRIELANRWYRHRYPRRFSAPAAQQHNSSIVNSIPMR